jgi:hypothetical protein
MVPRLAEEIDHLKALLRAGSHCCLLCGFVWAAVSFQRQRCCPVLSHAAKIELQGCAERERQREHKLTLSEDKLSKVEQALSKTEQALSEAVADNKVLAKSVKKLMDPLFASRRQGDHSASATALSPVSGAALR